MCFLYGSEKNIKDFENVRFEKFGKKNLEVLSKFQKIDFEFQRLENGFRKVFWKNFKNSS